RTCTRPLAASCSGIPQFAPPPPSTLILPQAEATRRDRIALNGNGASRGARAPGMGLSGAAPNVVRGMPSESAAIHEIEHSLGFTDVRRIGRESHAARRSRMACRLLEPSSVY